ncbi:hypothetical protein [Donghicola tyrosinivorans]|uniref:Uncharacterized protein n=1 Tax=Donghicola tyrosinivorans TaxID=1652492 RepID=A0A2T0WJ96_9RHOB|nr:hypothetical protein [Donghicola tyrosinivorans]PRY86780.1 hypothetical protein CLV74_1119 [Donghicola tyrosinivorans]
MKQELTAKQNFILQNALDQMDACGPSMLKLICKLVELGRLPLAEEVMKIAYAQPSPDSGVVLPYDHEFERQLRCIPEREMPFWFGAFSALVRIDDKPRFDRFLGVFQARSAN